MMKKDILPKCFEIGFIKELNIFNKVCCYDNSKKINLRENQINKLLLYSYYVALAGLLKH